MALTEATRPEDAEATGVAVTPAPAVAAPPVPEPAPVLEPPSLKRQLVRGSIWTLFGFGVGNVLRLGSSLVLARLLTPDIYGQLTIPFVVIIGLEMFSDLGSGPAIVRDKRGDDPAFLNTAWTMQIVRGMVLWIIASLMGRPLSVLFHQPDMAWLMVGVGATAGIAGFNSTKLFTAERHLALGRLTAVELAHHAMMIGVMIAIAYHWQSPWALIIGSLVGKFMRMVLSHVALPGVSNRPAWDREAWAALSQFGKWIFLGSAVFFVARQGDRVLLASFVAVSTLGVYYWAVQWSEAIISLAMQLSRKVLLPGLSRIARDREEDLSRTFYAARQKLNLLFLPGVGALIAAGSVFIELCFPAQWHAAGWMLEMLCVQAACYVFLEPCEQCIVALGHTRYVFYTHVARALWVIVGIPIGWFAAGGGVPAGDWYVHGEAAVQPGVAGVLAVVATSEIVVGAIHWTVLRRLGILRIGMEGRAALLLAGGFAVGLAVDWAWEIVRPMVQR